MNEEKIHHLKFFGIPKLLPYLKKYAPQMIVMIIFALAGSALDLAFPKFQEYAINVFVAQDHLNGIAVFVIVYVAVILLKVAADTISSFLGIKMEMKVGRDLKQASFNHLQSLSFSYFNQNSVGYILSRVSSDTNRIGTLISWHFLDCIWNLTYMVGALVIMFITNAKLALLVLIIVPLITVIVSLVQRKLLSSHRMIREKNSKITGGFNEGITGAKTLKTLVAENKMFGEFSEDTENMRKLSVRESRYLGILRGTLNIASYVALAIVLKVGGDFTAENLMAVGTLSLFMSYSVGLMTPIRWVISAISQLVNIQVNIERFFGLMETESDVKDSDEVKAKYGDTFNPKKENWEELKGDIEFENVSFKYPDGDEYVLTDFNLKVPFGTNIAIVGETGAGKSTLVNLVCRFYEPTNGRILIDGRDVRERSQLWLHSNIGYVLQTPHLFSGSIRDNLKYGSPDATDEELMDALRLVSAEDIVLHSPEGLSMDVGEGGDLLSTGEKQLISFARAIIHNPKILILDEATSSIDSFTEQKIQSSIKKVIEGRTSFVIAHRLSTVKNADKILVVRDGKIVESGSHSELIKAKGYYFDLYTEQYREDETAALKKSIEEST